MPGYLDPASSLTWGYTDGEDGWGGATNRSLRQLAYVGATRSVKNRTTAAPPSSPTEGDKYIVAANPTGLWASYNAGDIAVWGRGLTTPATLAWQRFQPQRSFIFYDESTDQVIKYNGTEWDQLTVTVPTADKPIWSQSSDYTLSGTLTAGITSTVHSLGIIDVNPIGVKLVTAAKYGAYVTATASTASGAFPIDVVTTFWRGLPESSYTGTRVSFARLTSGYDLGNGYMLTAPPTDSRPTKYNWGLWVAFRSATGGPYNVTLNYVAGPRLI